MRKSNTLGLIGLLAATVVALGTASPAHAATSTGPAAGKCANTVDAQYLRMGSSPSTSTVNPAADAAVAELKAQSDPYTGPRPDRSAAHDAQKLAGAKQGNPNACSGTVGMTANATTGPGYGYLGWMYHYGQNTGSWCGEATVEVISSTTPGASRLAIPQSEIAGWLGNGTNDGTDAGQMVNALNHYVGVPDFGWNFYGMVWMNGNPTSAQRNAFLSDLQIDVLDYSTPVAGNAWEVRGGPHLAGHPNQEIFHHFAIGGYNTNSSQIWYTDSATTVWSSVPAYSWFDLYTAETILGGRGYVW